MIIVVFRSRLSPDAHDDYETTAARMDELAVKMPGYIAHKTFAAEDGERLTLVEFESEEAIKAWRQHPEHVEAQRKGRSKFYSEFRVAVCDVLREQRFTRNADAN
jgi:heme-degrading monooxygenase HmoA